MCVRFFLQFCELPHPVLSQMQAKTDVGFAQWSNATTYNIRLVIPANPAGGLLSFSQAHYCTIRSIISEYILHQLPTHKQAQGS